MVPYRVKKLVKTIIILVLLIIVFLVGNKIVQDYANHKVKHFELIEISNDFQEKIGYREFKGNGEFFHNADESVCASLIIDKLEVSYPIEQYENKEYMTDPILKVSNVESKLITPTENVVIDLRKLENAASFVKMTQLKEGDIIKLVNINAEEIVYEVTDNRVESIENADKYIEEEIKKTTPDEKLSLITNRYFSNRSDNIIEAKMIEINHK